MSYKYDRFDQFFQHLISGNKNTLPPIIIHSNKYFNFQREIVRCYPENGFLVVVDLGKSICDITLTRLMYLYYFVRRLNLDSRQYCYYRCEKKSVNKIINSYIILIFYYIFHAASVIVSSRNWGFINRFTRQIFTFDRRFVSISTINSDIKNDCWNKFLSYTG